MALMATVSSKIDLNGFVSSMEGVHASIVVTCSIVYALVDDRGESFPDLIGGGVRIVLNFLTRVGSATGQVPSTGDIRVESDHCGTRGY